MLLLATLLALADCQPIPVERTTPVRARIDDGSCVDASGRYQLFTVQASTDEILWATVQPAPGSTFSNPSIEIVPPGSDTTPVPRVTAAVAATLRVRATAGLWTFRVGGQPGEYLFTLRVRKTQPRDDRLCVYQLMMCNSTASWTLTPQHCDPFDAGRYSASFRVWGVAGDVISIDLASDAFEPAVTLGPKDSGSTFAWASGITRAFLQYRFTTSDIYDVNVTGVSAKATGPFTIHIGCARSGCVAPSILSISGAGSVGYGHSATLSAAAAGFPAPQFEWFDAGALPTYIATTPTLTTPPVQHTQSYTVRATNPCGDETSDILTVVPTPARRRALGSHLEN